MWDINNSCQQFFKKHHIKYKNYSAVQNNEVEKEWVKEAEEYAIWRKKRKNVGGKKTEHQIHMGQYCKFDYRNLKYQKEKKEKKKINIKYNGLNHILSEVYENIIVK